MTSVFWSETLEPDALGENIKDVAMCQRIKTKEADSGITLNQIAVVNLLKSICKVKFNSLALTNKYFQRRKSLMLLKVVDH